MSARDTAWTAFAAVVGLALGWQAAARRHGDFRQDLFHRRPLRRLAALGWLETAPAGETVRLIRDYLGWERQPLLRHRAERLLRRLETSVA